VNRCYCTTVVYQLVSACGSCQGRDIVKYVGSLDAAVPFLTFNSWSAWRINCADNITSIASYPSAIPGTTAVPAWAYINIVAEDRFNATEALALVGGAESSAGGSTSTAASTSSPPASSTPSSTSSSTSSTSTDSGVAAQSNTNTGAIAGGTVGGIVGLGVIICLAIFLMKRQSKNFDPAAVGFRRSPLNNGLTGDYSHGVPNIDQGEMGSNNVVGVDYGGSPWSPPPTGHALGPSGGPYSSVYAPRPPGPGTEQAYGYTTPLGDMG
jgi:hypothetical protein